MEKEKEKKLRVKETISHFFFFQYLRLTEQTHMFKMKKDTSPPHFFQYIQWASRMVFCYQLFTGQAFSQGAMTSTLENTKDTTDAAPRQFTWMTVNTH